MSRKPTELPAVREQIKNLVGNAAVEMVKNGIAEANKGHYAAMKFLFELVGLFPAGQDAEQGADDGGLAKALFNRLGVLEAGPEVTNVFPAKSVSGSDAVE
jgi:hypothetical protein